MQEIDGDKEKLDEICSNSARCKNSEKNWLRCKPCNIKICYFCNHCTCEQELILSPDRGLNCMSCGDEFETYW